MERIETWVTYRYKMELLLGTLWWVDAGWMPGAHQSRSITPPPQLDRGEKIERKADGSR